MNIDRMDKYILAIDYVKYLNNYYFQRFYIYVYICISNINAYKFFRNPTQTYI